LVASISSVQYDLSEAVQSLAAGVEGAQANEVYRADKGKAAKVHSSAAPVGWFSNRRRIPAHGGLRVARFHVWQDLPASVENDVALLHAAITFELSNEWYSGLSRPNGVIKIENMRTGAIIEARLMIHQASYGIESARSVLKRQLQFVMLPTSVYKFNRNEPVRGFAQMKFWNRKATIVLPETSVLLIR
jgi:hypothetical protein